MRREGSRLLCSCVALGALAAGTAAMAQQQQQEQRQRPQANDRTPAFVSIGSINDATVTNAAGATVADINDLLVDMRTGQAAYAIIETHEVEGLDEKQCLVPYGALGWDPQTGQYRLNCDTGMLANLPPFNANNISQLDEESWLSTMRGVFGERSEFDAFAEARNYDEYSWVFKHREPAVLRGEIEAIKPDARSTMAKPYYAIVVSADQPGAQSQPATVLLAPKTYLDQQNQVPQQGETITINAVRAIDANGQTVYVAKSVTVSGQQAIHLRDANGTPQWTTDQRPTPGATGAYRMASELPGGTFMASDGSEFGDVNDAVFEARSGTAAYAIVSSGGVLGIDDTDYAIPCGSFMATANGNLYCNLPAEKLKLAPKLSEDGVKDLNANEFRNQVSSFFGVEPKEYDTMRSARWIGDGSERRERN